ncbi:MAG: CapA family protein [Ruminococcus sp.]|nr:CapA family protein [Ruminococcus sp.]
MKKKTVRLRKGRVAAVALIAAISICAVYSSCSDKIERDAKLANAGSQAVVTQPPTEPPTTQPPTEPPVVDKRIHIVATGDNLVQTAVYRNAQQHAGDGVSYNFKPMYENVRHIIEGADISIINQETLICNGEYEISGSNFNFNSPVELGQDMIDIGFDVFTIANNHVLDKGTGGLSATLDYWDEKALYNDIVVCGAYRNEADANNIRTMEIDGVTIAFLAYTEHMNGYRMPASSEMRVVLTSEEDVMEAQIREASEIADVVITAMHWGVEDTHTVSEDRKELAQKLVDWGCDVILGTHPHTAETMEYITRADGSRGFVYYSLGNFISAQTDNFNVVGEIADFTVVVDGETGEVTLEDVYAIPVINHYDDGKFSNMRLYPYNMYTSELADGHGLPYAPLGTAKSFNMGVIDRIIENNIPEEFRKLD